MRQVYDKTPRPKIAGRIMVNGNGTKQQASKCDAQNTAPKSHVASYTPTFKRILVAVDNSPRASMAIDTAVAIARKFGSEVVGIHVYAARLHDRRFVEMEDGLPEKYQQPQELKRQRDIHDSLITKGLEMIAESYLDVVAKKCHEHGVRFSRQRVEGKNYKELVGAIQEQRYDLVVMGLTGLGETEKDVIGSVCLRVIRRVQSDCLIIKNGVEMGGRIVVAIDGSPQSFGGLKTALALGKELVVPVEAVAAFDPDFHVTAFRSLEGILSDEAGKVFRFREQERLHNEIIDKGIAKIYRDHLELARKVAVEEGMQIETQLLRGKPFSAILDHLRANQSSLLVVGRVGVHADDNLDIGSNTENLLRSAPCNVLISARVYSPQPASNNKQGAVSLPWDEDALARLDNVPEFARGMAKKAIEDYARSEGHEIVTVEAMLAAREKFGM
ncbi:MAG: universal stress protein [Bacteroidota bacterium]